jgi:type II secretory pathway pseudopilin PulG
MLELMLIVFIISMLVLIATPQIFKARTTSQQKSCISNLRRIEMAKEQWAMAYDRPSGHPVTAADLYPEYLRGSLPSCPGGGTYAINDVGHNATCTLGGSIPSHALP